MSTSMKVYVGNRGKTPYILSFSQQAVHNTYWAGGYMRPRAVLA